VDSPVIVMVMLAPDAAVVGATMDGVPITVRAAFAVSLGLVAANCSVYAPAKTLAGTTKVTPENVPVPLTVTVETLVVIAVISVVPWYRLTVMLREPGVKPVPEIDTPVGMAPATMFEAPKVIAGVPKMVRVVVAELPDASVTTMISAPGAVVAETLKPTFAIKSPVVPVTTVTPVASADAGVVLVSSHVVVVPLIVSVCSEFAAKPVPVMVTFESGLTAVSAPNLGMIVYVAVAAAPVAPTTLIVCAPAVA